MKKSLWAMAAFGAFAVEAHAQNSATLYGIIDAGVVYTSNVNGSKQYQLASSNQQGTRWGMRIIENLGGGLSALAVIENSFNVVNGKMTAGNLFGGQVVRRTLVVADGHRDAGPAIHVGHRLHEPAGRVDSMGNVLRRPPGRSGQYE